MDGHERVNKWLNSALGALLPTACLLCGGPTAERAAICRACSVELRRIGAACRRCGLPLATGDTCGACLRMPPPYGGCLVPWHYAPPLDQLIQRLKYGGQLAVARLLGELLAQEIAPSGIPMPDCLLPVPLHPGRLRERGFNQALELARPLARRLGIPLDLYGCRRIRSTDSQSSLSATDRRRNVRGAFAAEWLSAPQRVAIVDDVLSTGSTVTEVARALKRAGVREVYVWAVARAVR